MRRTQGMVFYDKEDIKGRMYKTSAAKDIEVAELHAKTSMLDQIPDSIKWRFVCDHNLIQLPEEFELVGVPCDMVERARMERYYAQMIEDPVLSEERREYYRTLMAGQDNLFDNRAVEYRTGLRRLEKETCYIWFLSDGKLNGVFVEAPSALLNGLLNPVVSYTCSHCGVIDVVENDLPEMFYDPNSEKIYCPKCAGNYVGTLMHIGE